MELLCYAFKNIRGELEAPFLNYLEKYAIRDQNFPKRDIQLKQLANIESHLRYLVGHQAENYKQDYLKNRFSLSLTIPIHES